MFISERWNKGLKALVEAEQAKNPTMTRLTIQNLKVSEVWAAETEEYRQEMEEKTRIFNEKEKEAYRLKAFKVSTTPAEYAQ
jgi:hypothetical protein